MKYIIFKIFLLISIVYHSYSYSNTSENKNFNHRYLSNYFSALLSYDNKNNDQALKYFNSSKYLLNRHEQFLKKYVFSLVENGQVLKAINQIKYSKNINNTQFFEASLLMAVDRIKKKNFSETLNYLETMESLIEDDTYEYIIYETLKSYNKVFLEKNLETEEKKFGKLSLITNAFQNCYLKKNKANTYFANLINSPEGDYSRYLFFYLKNIIQNKNYAKAKEIVSEIDPLNSSLIISQAKNWVDKYHFEKFNNFFSCDSENDILAEFFFLIANLYSAEDDFKKSNFYLNISIYLNPKFYLIYHY